MIKTISKVRVANVKPHTYKANINQAELRQTISREYASRSIGNDMQSAFAPMDAFNLPNNSYQSERVCWADVPKEWTLEKVQDHLDKMNSSSELSPCIYQVLSFEPVLTSDDKAFMARLSDFEREAFLDNKRENQQLINPSTGELITKDGRQVYRKLFFSNTHKEDIDNTATRRVAAAELTEVAAPQARQTSQVNAYAAVDF